MRPAYAEPMDAGLKRELEAKIQIAAIENGSTTDKLAALLSSVDERRDVVLDETEGQALRWWRAGEAEPAR